MVSIQFEGHAQGKSVLAEEQCMFREGNPHTMEHAILLFVRTSFGRAEATLMRKGRGHPRAQYRVKLHERASL